MSNLNSKEYAVLYALMSGEHAEPVNELALRVESHPRDVGLVLDGLVERGILEADVFYPERAGELGELDYMFAGADHAQQAYMHILQENPWLEPLV